MKLPFSISTSEYLIHTTSDIQFKLVAFNIYFNISLTVRPESTLLFNLFNFNLYTLPIRYTLELFIIH